MTAYHAVWVTRFRQPIIDEGLRPALHEYLHDKIIEYGGAALAVGGTDDHVHLVFTKPPEAALAPFIGRLKGSSSHWVNHFYRPGGSFAWQRGYGVATVAEDELDRVREYVRDQAIHHRRASLIASYERLDSPQAPGLQKKGTSP